MIEALKPLVLAAVVTLILGPPVLAFLRRLKAGQTVRSDGPRSHLAKAGTPTMGGVLFLIGLTVSTLVLAPPSPLTLSTLILTWGYALIGLVDDGLKVILHRPLGLMARQKLGGQVLLGLVAGVAAMLWLGRGSVIQVPVTGWHWDLGWYYPLLAALLLVATTNAVNLTDGLDGLAAGITLWVALAYGILALTLGQGELVTFAMALAGGCLGFLVYNFHPARVFMGDTGSLALGAAIGFLAIMTRTELVLPVLGGVYVLETLSVILQVVSFRLTGRRLFRMSPLHHHFELGGWPESRVVLFFWALAIIMALAGLYLLTI
ncbi:phospho-N-acetylmuramoyl-pentapeptide-transferase [Neomoorella thermoacetica]|uniref:Phospho-N-acetylmuramoyl-pentapeptide-transferase n=3 Tax=Neomoorella thermoacetica TaxID=1525 RepID=MRAY_MOOTA|nr:phospho-N-acetylmuramoyl-pentapeptide-transferase [Moorella thermoacetica]Q2RK82.1 RecName: Full=Phospho-N-acetylmuramoyl-pentapeptide-transferase; AltName: Full=UDP-MurNAc-pentapeptide phosphotransferase [Moorella thermoacetica ATCC 39073]AKX93590.1 phospho-N-acetylmuramoyl-pentapeptide-transferase [Moorella thermoacetica]AKX96237.1 phospho-N-acetylmuramoyl-pentapeptide-transferase [Moorella thermoacetica]OIQ09756.1 phospho-N-acetylmuramoyl-pentapeptide-transferase [Moorella thermoacetica]